MTSLLALDFDGVVVDALLECAVVTRAGADPAYRSYELADAVSRMRDDYLEKFSSVRPYSRTLQDFMVTNAIDRPIRNLAEFEAARDEAGPTRLSSEARAAQSQRGVWRDRDPSGWLQLHRDYPGVAELIRSHRGGVWVVSNKDAASIDAILAHLGLAEHVSGVVGEASDKAAVVRRLVDDHGDVTFVDDNVANVASVGQVAGATGLWATWGYHSHEDRALSARLRLQRLTLDALASVA